MIQRGIDHCAQCEQYALENSLRQYALENSLRQHVLAERLVAYEEVQHRVGGEIPEEDYLRFIRPYENKKRLDALKAAHPREP